MAIATEQIYPLAKSVSYGPVIRWSLYIVLVIISSGIGLILLPFIFKLLNVRTDKKTVRKCTEEAPAVMEKFIGQRPQYIDVAHSMRQSDRTISATGIAYANQVFYIMDHGLCAKLTLDDIRNWEWKINGASHSSTVVTGNAMQTVLQAQSDIREAKRAEFTALVGSGFFITVADIAKPVWQFMTSDKNVLNKWMEIFAQVQEGKI